VTAYAELHERRRVEGDIDQREVDRLFGLMRGGDSVSAGLPKGHSSPTAERIVGVLRDSEDSLSAVDVAERVGVIRATAQRYLSSLAHAEVVRLELNYGSTGRPEHRYRLEIS
jgi:response regulator of citrate/malate metabolism